MSVVQDIAEELKGLDTGSRALRSFGLLLAGVSGAAALLLYRKGLASWQVWAAVAAVLAIAGTLGPALLRAPYRVWMSVGMLLGWLMTRIILFLAFVIVMTPMGWLVRALGKDVLDQRIDRQAGSYWKERRKATGREQYTKQF